jgi:hypothetical protein
MLQRVERGLRGFVMHLKVVRSRANREYEGLDAQLRQVIEEA